MIKQYYNTANKSFIVIDTAKKGGIISVGKEPDKNYPVENLGSEIIRPEVIDDKKKEILNPDDLKELQQDVNGAIVVELGGRKSTISALDIIEVKDSGKIKFRNNVGAITEKEPGNYSIKRSGKKKDNNADNENNWWWD